LHYADKELLPKSDVLILSLSGNNFMNSIISTSNTNAASAMISPIPARLQQLRAAMKAHALDATSSLPLIRIYPNICLNTGKDVLICQVLQVRSARWW
jgi:hypothetical protein